MKPYRNTLAAILFLTTPAFTTSSPAQVCSGGSLLSYIALGASGCSVGNLEFSNFTYSPSAYGPGNLVLASDVQVAPINQPGNAGLSFNGNWNAPAMMEGASQSAFKLT